MMSVVRLALFLSLIIHVTLAYARNASVDSLKNTLNTELTKSERVDVLQALGDKLNGSDPLVAVQYYKEALVLSKELNDLYKIMMAKRGMGVCYIFLGDYEEALDFTYQSLALAEEVNDHTVMIKAYNNIGVIYVYLDKYDESLETYTLLMQMLLPEDKSTWQNVYANLGMIYREKKMYESALYYYGEGLRLAIENFDPSNAAIIHHNKANLYTNMDRYDDAKIEFEKALEMGSKTDNATVVNSAWMNLGGVNTYLGNYDEAAFQINKGIELSKQKGLKRLVRDGYKFMADLYKKTNRSDLALEYIESYMALKDSIINEENTAKINVLQSKLQIEEKEKENAILKNQAELQNSKIKNQNYLLSAIAICLLITSFLAITYYKFNKDRRTSNMQLKQLNSEISAQKEKIELQSSNLQVAYEEIKSINENLEKLIAQRTKKIYEQNEKLVEYAFINAHKLRSPIARILGLISILKEPNQEDNIQEVIKKLDAESKDLDQVVIEINKVLQEEGYKINEKSRV